MDVTQNNFKTLLLVSLSLLTFNFSLSLAQEVEEKKATETSKIEKPKATQAVEGDVVFKDGNNNQLMRITDEGTTGAIQFQDGVPSDTGFKLYRNGLDLHFNGSLLGGGATKIDDLTDAKQVSSSLYLGDGAGAANSPYQGNESVGIGFSASHHVTTGISNVALGYYSNYYNESGSENTMIGAEAGSGSGVNSISGSVFLGFKAGRNETTSNKLYIENSDSDTPLIWGDFTNGIEQVKINGKFSVGDNSSAYGARSFAGGNSTQSHGEASIAFGKDNLAWGDHSAAFGLGSKAHSYLTTAIGRFNVGNGILNQTNWVATDPLFEIGNGTADGNRSNAMTVLKNGNTSINGSLDVNGKAALGYNVGASGTNSFAIGSNVNASGNGTIFLGDNSAASSQNATNDNRFAARFANGYRFYTTSDLSIGAKMDAGDNSWTVTSDSTKKTNFKTVDGYEILNKISKFKLTSWNYKTQDSQTHRHYGPMAQDFYSAFGHDGIGRIGNDTTIASADFDGINFIAIQALEKRSTEQEVRIKELEKLNNELAILNTEIRIQNSDYKNQNLELRTDIEQIKNTLNQVIANNNEIRMTTN